MKKSVHTIVYPSSSAVDGSSKRSRFGFDDALDTDICNQIKPAVQSSSISSGSFPFTSAFSNSEIWSFDPSSSWYSSKMTKNPSSKWTPFGSKSLELSSSSSSLESQSLSFAEISSSMETLMLSSDFENSDDVVKTLAPEIYEANSESRKSRSIMPLLKQELKSKIQLGRLKAGKEELKVDFTPSQHKMSFKELTKRERTREQHRMSALRSRNKQRQHEQQIQKRYEEVDSINTKLLEQLARLRFEKDTLFTTILNHLQKECQATSRDDHFKRLMSLTASYL